MMRPPARGPMDFAVDYGTRLSQRISAALLAVLGALWLTGVGWLLVHYLYARPGEFGVARQPLETPLLTIHGVLALLGLFLLGWFAGRHAGVAAGRQRRASGWWLTLWMAALVLAGGAQFFLSSELWQARVTLLHEILGAALLLPVLAHGWYFSVAARARDRARGVQGSQAPRHRRRHGPPAPRSARN
ncbi:MAG TPA: hypothetical protein VK130_08965 [Steroidobacteraceae bacterium]|nr:hypothetical protein [Steroidobacteraceae bacterium]